MKTSDPKLNVFNRQRRLSVETESLRCFLERLVQRLELGRSLSVVLVSDAVMRNYHRRYKGEDRTTDVLSFPYHPEPWEDPDEYAGDIIISVETAERQNTGGLLQELQALSLHGLLHLLGYDHETDSGQMDLLEAELRKEFQLH